MYLNKINLLPFTWDYAKPLYEMVKAHEVNQYLDLIVNTYEDYEKWLQKIEWLELMGETLHWTIWNESKELIGEVYLTHIDQENKRAEMGTWIGTKFWRKGYNHQVKEKVLKEAYTYWDLNEILFFVQKGNHQAIHSLMKLPYITGVKDDSYTELLRYKEYKLGRKIELLIAKKEDFFQSS